MDRLQETRNLSRLRDTHAGDQLILRIEVGLSIYDAPKTAAKNVTST